MVEKLSHPAATNEEVVAAAIDAIGNGEGFLARTVEAWKHEVPSLSAETVAGIGSSACEPEVEYAA